MNGIIHNPNDVGHTLIQHSYSVFVENTRDIGLKCQHFIGGKGIRLSYLAVYRQMNQLFWFEVQFCNSTESFVLSGTRNIKLLKSQWDSN